MGQEITNPPQQPPYQDVLTREVSLYRWRADPNFNSHLPRTFFKNASLQQQQELFAQFISQQQEKQYLQLYKFKQKLRNINTFNQEQIVVFQENHSSLKQLKNQLTFEQSVYALYGLLTGYEQIKKIFNFIIVDPSCCFITVEGYIRAWINPCPKINQVWHGTYKQIIGEQCQNTIISQIIKMVQQSTRQSKRSTFFFTQLHSALLHKIKINCNFSSVRKWINEYCFIHRVQMPKSISIKKQKQEYYDQKYNKKSIKTQAKSIRNSFKQKNHIFKSTIQSQTANHQNNIVKSKSIDQKMFLTHQNHFNHSIPINVKFNSSQQVYPRNVQSAILTYNQQNHKRSQKKLQKYSFAVQTEQNQSKKSSQSQINRKEHQMFQSQCFKIRYNKIDEVSQAKSISSPLVTHQKIEDKDIKVELQRKQSKKNSILKKKPQKARNPMQVSLMNVIEESKKQLATHKTENKFKTAYLSRDQIDSNASQDFSRPWITTKTITRLISDHSHPSSLQNSIAQSSEYYNCSQYSGALTQMGRDITNKQSDGNRTKTLRVSRDFQL